ncbi:hypothetical protein BU23DRAFT_564424 [Bimuria novae-zelandiae CBS 107.79]|uniref:Uncharacterized protein n=1 Tax=Bimuria novae-zelandiae CBS 107.79 TaxID=1447943 RepID=A0A6A5VKF5_9PLEO|nr:hypothetical protein BU23DRAFT_564424 [Bimuria novae-zelandiae CBS 107.79]
MKKQHHQTLEDVLAEIPDFDHPRWNIIRDLVTIGQFFSLHTKHVPGPDEWVMNKEKQKVSWRRYPRDNWECPILATDFLPCKLLPSLDQLKAKLKEEIRTQSFQFASPLKESKDKHATAEKLIDSLKIQRRNPVLPLNRISQSSSSATPAFPHGADALARSRLSIYSLPRCRNTVARRPSSRSTASLGRWNRHLSCDGSVWKLGPPVRPVHVTHVIHSI